uniref:Uncharacterized protein n=1 Tax=Lepeophtheirus salmonis TaxID=72036 RepID=A0A0K2UW98_LEPSM
MTVLISSAITRQKVFGNECFFFCFFHKNMKTKRNNFSFLDEIKTRVNVKKLTEGNPFGTLMNLLFNWTKKKTS